LDRRNSQMVFELLRALAEDEKGRTVVLSSHDPTAKEYAHRSCELVDGHLEDSC
ncbi:MAG: ABC transporter ATP-binding protein, partial [Cutibacterium acnes]|nr:ABC transporter ATP-binding protein [Cutibacterium acnes]